MVGEGIPGRDNSMGKGMECPGCNNKLLSTAGDVGMSSSGRQAGQRDGFFTKSSGLGLCLSRTREG